MYSGAGKIDNAVNDNFPKRFARSFIDTSCTDNTHPVTFLKSTLPSPEAGTLASPSSLLSSPKILFSVLGEELISLSL